MADKIAYVGVDPGDPTLEAAVRASGILVGRTMRVFGNLDGQGDAECVATITGVMAMAPGFMRIRTLSRSARPGATSLLLYWTMDGDGITALVGTGVSRTLFGSLVAVDIGKRESI